MSADPRIEPAPTSHLQVSAVEALLALADDELVIGHRHSEWLGLSPFLEEDLTLSSIAQDEFGHARALYALIWPEWEGREAGVTRRPADQFRSCELTELPGSPWELSLVRHFLYDIAEPMRWQELLLQFGGQVPGLADLVPTVLAEERFHARHATDLVVRLGSQSEGAARLQPHLDALAPLAVSMLGRGLLGEFAATVDSVLSQTQLRNPFADLSSLIIDPTVRPTQGPRTSRSAGFADVHESLLTVVGFDPAASW